MWDAGADDIYDFVDVGLPPGKGAGAIVEKYGEDRFEKLLIQERAGDLNGLFEKLQKELKDYRGEAPVGDDVTLVIVRRDP